MYAVLPRDLQKPWEATSACLASVSAGLAWVDYGGKAFFPISLRGRAAPDRPHHDCGGNNMGADVFFNNSLIPIQLEHECTVCSSST